jgi:two-component system, cell cycle sensor histidine kinase and response regulator CckA
MCMEGKKKILLVDDEKRFAESLQSILKHYEYDCAIAYNGSHAIQCLSREHFEIALLDVDLPDISGCAVAEFVQQSCKHTTVIMLTGMATVKTAVEAMKNGAYDFLSKPVDPDNLLKILDKALEHNALKMELQVSEKRFRTLAEVAWEGIAIYDNSLLLEANKQFYAMFGYRQEELAKEQFWDALFTPESIAAMREHSESEQAVSFEVIGIHKDGNKIHIEVKTCSIEYLGRTARVLIMRDISHIVKHEREKLALQEKLAQASKLNALGLMAGSVAHDLNNILTAVVSYPDLLLAQMEEGEKYYDEIKKIQGAGKQAAAVVADLVSIARGGIRKTRIADLNTIVREHLKSIEHSERLLHFPEVFVQISLQQDLACIECSPEHIKKVLLNLIGNALESIRKEGVVSIETKNCTISDPVATELYTLEPGHYVKLTVADNGPGIDPQAIDNIFTPFYSTKQKKKSGTGLGLSIVWNVIQEHKGLIEVKNLNPGVAFEIYFRATENEMSVHQDSSTLEPVKGNGETILIVDDQKDQNFIIGKMLDMLGYNFLSVTSGEEAVAFLQNNSADLVFLDMLMGDGWNGRQTYEKILEVSPNQKAVIISGYCEMTEIEKAKDLGVLACLEKPISLQSLKMVIQEAL